MTYFRILIAIGIAIFSANVSEWMDVAAARSCHWNTVVCTSSQSWGIDNENAKKVEL